jgi:hypothetical protein
VAWRYKDAAKHQARQGIISWATYRAYCADVDRIKRARLTEAREAARIPDDATVRRSRDVAATSALMKCRHTTGNKDTHLDRQRRNNVRAARQAEVVASLRAAPELSDREHARRIGVDHKTVASVRQRMQESGEIPHFLRRKDPRTDRLSQPSTRRRHPVALLAKAVI